MNRMGSQPSDGTGAGGRGGSLLSSWLSAVAGAAPPSHSSDGNQGSQIPPRHDGYQRLHRFPKSHIAAINQSYYSLEAKFPVTLIGLRALMAEDDPRNSSVVTRSVTRQPQVKRPETPARADSIPDIPDEELAEPVDLMASMRKEAADLISRAEPSQQPLDNIDWVDASFDQYVDYFQSQAVSLSPPDRHKLWMSVRKRAEWSPDRIPITEIDFKIAECLAEMGCIAEAVHIVGTCDQRLVSASRTLAKMSQAFADELEAYISQQRSMEEMLGAMVYTVTDFGAGLAEYEDTKKSSKAIHDTLTTRSAERDRYLDAISQKFTTDHIRDAVALRLSLPISELSAHFQTRSSREAANIVCALECIDTHVLDTEYPLLSHVRDVVGAYDALNSLAGKLRDHTATRDNVISTIHDVHALLTNCDRYKSDGDGSKHTMTPTHTLRTADVIHDGRNLFTPPDRVAEEFPKLVDAILAIPDMLETKGTHEALAGSFLHARIGALHPHPKDGDGRLARFFFSLPALVEGHAFMSFRGGDGIQAYRDAYEMAERERFLLPLALVAIDHSEALALEAYWDCAELKDERQHIEAKGVEAILDDLDCMFGNPSEKIDEIQRSMLDDRLRNYLTDDCRIVIPTTASPSASMSAISLGEEGYEKIDNRDFFDAEDLRIPTRRQSSVREFPSEQLELAAPRPVNQSLTARLMNLTDSFTFGLVGKGVGWIAGNGVASVETAETRKKTKSMVVESGGKMPPPPGVNANPHYL